MLIERVRIKGFWNKYSLDWRLNKDINILSGVNGSGKTTLLEIIYSVLHPGTGSFSLRDKVKVVEIMFKGGYRVIHECENGREVSVYKRYDKEISRFKMDFPQMNLITRFDKGLCEIPTGHIRRESFDSKVNELFCLLHKKLDDTTNELRFLLEDGTIIYPCDLSAGEKRLLNILSLVYIQGKQDIVWLWDEPETSMCIDCQRAIIPIVRDMNPSGQWIIATHSPSIIYGGWERKVVNMEDLLE